MYISIPVITFKLSSNAVYAWKNTAERFTHNINSRCILDIISYLLKHDNGQVINMLPEPSYNRISLLATTCDHLCNFVDERDMHLIIALSKNIKIYVKIFNNAIVRQQELMNSWVLLPKSSIHQ